MRPLVEGSTILYVGDDVCQRIPVMQREGFNIVQSEESIDAIRRALARGSEPAATILHSDVYPLPDEIAMIARCLSPAPLVLFENPCTCFRREDFDLVIPALTPPKIWLNNLMQITEVSRELMRSSRLNR